MSKGELISGQDYLRLEQTPLSSRILPKVRSVESSGAIALWEDKGDRFRFHCHPEILRSL